jgi:hypothetical protein
VTDAEGLGADAADRWVRCWRGFAADVPHVYEALETTHCVLLMAYP